MIYNNKTIDRLNWRYFYKKDSGVYVDKDDDISKDSLSSIIKHLKNMVSYERPDMYSVIENIALVIEHYEFDSSENNSKGSLERKEIARVERKNTCEFENKLEPKLVHDIIKTNPSFTNYMQNCTSIFQAHYSKIPEYKEHLLEDDIVNNETIIKTAFFIEDSTTLGNHIINTEGDPQYLNLLYTDFFLRLIENSKEQLNYIFFGCYTGNRYQAHFMDVNSVELYRAKILPCEGFFSLTPNVTGFNMSMPINDNDGDDNE